MRITDLTVLPSASLDDILYIIDKSDTTDFLSGSSKQITVQNLFADITVPSASYALTASSVGNGTVTPDGHVNATSLTVTGNSLFFGDVTIYGSSSIVNISSSTVVIGDNRIQLNAWSTGSLSQRYAGLDLTDSGSSNNVTSSLLWDSQNNYWLLTNNQTGSQPLITSSALILQGPVSTFGEEKLLPINTFLKVETPQGNLTSSNLVEVNDLLTYNGTISSSAVSASSAFFGLDVLVNGVLKVFSKIYAYAGIVGDLTGSISGSSAILNNITSSVVSSSTILTSYAQINSGSINDTIIGNTVSASANFTVVNVNSITSSTISTNDLTASGYISASNVYVENTITSDTGSFIYFNINNTGSAPTNYNDSGTIGEVRFDNNFIYIYTNNRWVRSPISKW